MEQFFLDNTILPALSSTAAIAQLGERQTEDLDVRCSIHRCGRSDSFVRVATVAAFSFINLLLFCSAISFSIEVVGVEEGHPQWHSLCNTDSWIC
jgi:hypothetical protein